MAKMTDAIVRENGVIQTVCVDDALKSPQREYLCPNCWQPVRPHKSSKYGAAHFEHRNKCGASSIRAEDKPLTPGDGLDVLSAACLEASVDLVPLIEKTCRWVNPVTFRALPVWFPETARGKPMYNANYTPDNIRIQTGRVGKPYPKWSLTFRQAEHLLRHWESQENGHRIGRYAMFGESMIPPSRRRIELFKVRYTIRVLPIWFGFPPH